MSEMRWGSKPWWSTLLNLMQIVWKCQTHNDYHQNVYRLVDQWKHGNILQWNSVCECQRSKPTLINQDIALDYHQNMPMVASSGFSSPFGKVPWKRLAPDQYKNQLNSTYLRYPLVTFWHYCRVSIQQFFEVLATEVLTGNGIELAALKCWVEPQNRPGLQKQTHKQRWTISPAQLYNVIQWLYN